MDDDNDNVIYLAYVLPLYSENKELYADLFNKFYFEADYELMGILRKNSLESGESSRGIIYSSRMPEETNYCPDRAMDMKLENVDIFYRATHYKHIEMTKKDLQKVLLNSSLSSISISQSLHEIIGVKEL